MNEDKQRTDEIEQIKEQLKPEVPKPNVLPKPPPAPPDPPGHREALRDRLAMYAMPIAMEAAKNAGYSSPNWDEACRGTARRAYQLADAMLAAREEKQ